MVKANSYNFQPGRHNLERTTINLNIIMRVFDYFVRLQDLNIENSNFMGYDNYQR
jgi:hypothetical protein